MRRKFSRLRTMYPYRRLQMIKFSTLATAEVAVTQTGAGAGACGARRRQPSRDVYARRQIPETAADAIHARQ